MNDFKKKKRQKDGMRNPSKWTEIVIKFAVLVFAAVLMMHYWMLHELFEVISFYNFMFLSRSTQLKMNYILELIFISA